MTDEHGKYGEPWFSQGVAFGDNSGAPIAMGLSSQMGNDLTTEQRAERIKRAVAAVNFCKGIPTEQLEQAIEAGGLEALVGALHECAEFIGSEYASAQAQALEGEYISEEARPIWHTLWDALGPFARPLNSRSE